MKRHTVPTDPCPAPHQYGPGTFTAWHTWAEEMRRTHNLTDCPDCGLPVIWTPRGQPQSEADEPALLDLDGAQP